MGLYDRDYHRRDPRNSRSGGGFSNEWNAPSRGRRLGGMSMWSINTWIIAINALVFVADRLLIQAGIAYEVGQQIFRLPDGRMLVRSIVMGPLEHFGYFSADTAITHVQMWRFLSFQFLHANLSHIFFNMLALYFFGPLIEQYLGSRRYLVFYLLCGVVGPIAYLMLWGTGILVTSADAPMIGASAGVYGVLIATATIAPNAMVMLLFPPIPMKLKTLAWVFIGLAVFVVVTGGRNAGGEAAHLGGALAGWYLIRHVHLLNLFAPSRRR